MKRFVALITIAICSLGPIAVTAYAQDPSSVTPEEIAAVVLQRFIGRNIASADDVRTKALSAFERTDIDGGGVSETDPRLMQQLGDALTRSREIQRLLAKDLDGDMNVSVPELKRVFKKSAHQPIVTDGVKLYPTDKQVAQKLEQLVAKALAADLDGDRVISFSEIRTIAQRAVERRGDRKPKRLAAVPMELDLNADGTVSRDEFLQALARAFDDADSDSDGLISHEERQRLEQRNAPVRSKIKAKLRAEQEIAKLRESTKSCAFPTAGATDQVVVLGAYEGQALSTVSLGGDDQEVTVADIWIEPGENPLYILLTAHKAMIWRFSGAIDRISAVVPNSAQRTTDGAPRVGVVGVPADRVHFPPQPECLRHFHKADSPEATFVTKLLPHLIGRSADLTMGKYGISAVGLPSGLFDRVAAYKDAVELPESGPGAMLWREVLRFNPGGLVQIKSETVVSDVEAKRYSVLPREAGLAQLLEDGALQVIGYSQHLDVGGTRVIIQGDKKIIYKGDKHAIVEADQKPSTIIVGTPPVVSTLPSEFLIVKKIRFPAGLSGAHAVAFVLAKGVPEPEGSPGRSSVTRQSD